MNRIVTELNPTERQDLFLETANKLGWPPVIVEKDFWVCWILQRLFSSLSWKDHLVFKGGTSLSKVHKVIERFSEDIDLVLDWRVLGYSQNEPYEDKPSRTKQDKFNKGVVDKAREFLATAFLSELNKILSEYQGVEAFINDTDPDSVVIKYPAAFDNEYILPQIKLEIGPMASWTPSNWFEIRPYVFEEFPKQFKEPSCRLRAIETERTFWEKATILHQQSFQKDVIPPRYSRHYYDLYRMIIHGVGKKAMEDLTVLSDVVNFKNKFYSCAWANYDLAKPGTLKLVPPEHLLKGLKSDYVVMKTMIFGEYPDFERIMNSLLEFENTFNSN
jgi:hypothetical protein